MKTQIQKQLSIEIMEKILQYRTQLLFSEWCIHQEMYIEPGTKQRIHTWLEYFFQNKNSLYNRVFMTDVIIQNIEALQINIKPDKLQLKLNISFSHGIENKTTITKNNVIIQKIYCWNIYTIYQYHLHEQKDGGEDEVSGEKFVCMKNGFIITQIDE